ncbi:MAG: flagellar biosynthetic protein FliO [Acidobacteria bacterium]|nr:flagellar biosynthetic protein FliO [Acidobacteriota bacterium]
MHWTEQVLMTFAVLGLLCAAIWILRRKGYARIHMSAGRGGRKRSLEAVERLPLTPQHSLHLVRVAGRLILVGVSPAGCNLLQTTGLDLSDGSNRAGGEPV